MKQFSKYKSIILFIAILIAVNFIASQYFERLDLTQDKRYTLSEASEEIIKDIEEPIIIDVFLKGDFPSEFKRLQSETRQILEEYAAKNSNISFNFVNPLAEGGNAQQISQQFYQMGMSPARVNVMENGQNSETIIFPWAMANFGKKSVKIGLLKNQLGSSDEERVTNSVQQLEYAFTDAISKLIYPRKKKIAVMRGNGELPNANIADFVKTLQQYYFMAPFTLDSAAVNPQKTLQELKEYDLIIEAKPTEAYTENEKYILDQYTMNGGKSLWLTESVAMEKDSLLNPSGSALAFPRDLNLRDFFFSYGVRINPSLVNDIYSAPIILATGSGNDTRFNPYPWFYSPLTSSPNNHPIINNIEAVKFDFANPIDTLKNGVNKTVLLSSSSNTKLEETPREISLNVVGEKPDIASYTDGKQALAVLLEGEFTSVYKNRLKPFKIQDNLNESKATKMLVISDGDVIKNELKQGTPLALGFEKYSGTTYGNKEFLLNAVNYMLDDRGLMDIRTKKVTIAFLDPQKTAAERTKWQLITIVLPLLILGVFAVLYTWLRRKKYIRKK